MNKVDRDKFFSGYRSTFITLTQEQVDGLNSLLDSLESDQYVTDNRWAAYMLATVKHETANTFKPIHEYGSRQYFINRYGGQTALGHNQLGNVTPEDGATYAGEGDVQLTGKKNYEHAETELRAQYPDQISDFEKRTGKTFDLIAGDQPGDEADPQNAADPTIAYLIMSAGMRQGWFTGKKLPDFIHDDVCDYVNARTIINGHDKADKIATYAHAFQLILNGQP